MFKSANVVVVWLHRPLKHFKVDIKIVKQHVGSGEYHSASSWNLPDLYDFCGWIVGSSSGEGVSSFFKFAFECFIVDVCE